MFLYPLSTWIGGPWDLFIEHGHRLLASFVGLLTIGLVVSTWMAESRRWVRWYSVACLVLVISQGLLGGFRVLLDATLLARLHGCLGPLFFAVSVGAMCITSTWWGNATLQRGLGRESVTTELAGSMKRIAWSTVAMAYLQLVLGAHLRHVSPFWPPDVFRVVVLAHLVGAAVLTIHAGLIMLRVWQHKNLRAISGILVPAVALNGLIGLQLLAGAATWRVKYHWPAWMPQPESWQGYAVQAESMLQTMTVTLHVAVGSLILGTAVFLAIRCARILTHQTAIRATASAANLREVMA